MEYTNLIEPLMCISFSLFLGMIIGALYMYFKTSQDMKLMEVDLQIFQEQLQKCQSTLTHYLDKWKNKYEDDNYEAD